MDFIPKSVKNSVFLSNLYSKPQREYGKRKFKIGNRIRIFKYSQVDLPFRKGHKPEFTQEILKIVAFSSRKPHTDTIEDEQDEITRAEFYQKILIKVN